MMLLRGNDEVFFLLQSTALIFTNYGSEHSFVRSLLSRPTRSPLAAREQKRDVYEYAKNFIGEKNCEEGDWKIRSFCYYSDSARKTLSCEPAVVRQLAVFLAGVSRFRESLQLSSSELNEAFRRKCRTNGRLTKSYWIEAIWYAHNCFSVPTKYGKKKNKKRIAGFTTLRSKIQFL